MYEDESTYTDEDVSSADANPAGANPAPAGWWARQETARTPVRFRDRVLAQFTSAQNVGYLSELFARTVPRGPLRRHVLATLLDALLEFSSAGEGRALDILLSDPTARRGVARRAVGLWDEVRRLNTAFYEDRLEFLREHAATIDRKAPRDGVADDDEDYAMRMFIADSLRPPGLEHLNTPGPMFALREDQSTWIPRGAPPTGVRRAGAAGATARTHRENFQQAPPQAPVDSVSLDGTAIHAAPPLRSAQSRMPAQARAPPRARTQPAPSSASDDNGQTDVAGDDEAWSIGNPNRTPEQAMAEYWGDDRVTSETAIGAPETMGKAYGDIYAWGNAWEDNGGTRFMRRPEIPFWQQGGREGVDYDIEETLGTAARECDAHVRRWDMDAVRAPRGQEYRTQGPRSGHVV